MKVLLITLSIVAVAYARPDTGYAPSAGYLPAGEESYDYESSQFTDLNGIGGADFQGASGVGNLGGYSGYPQGEDQKHIYFYAAPEEPHYTRFRIFVAPSTQRNTKVIFIKAPHHAGVIPEVIAPPSQSEDKTLVYVLTRKPESQSITVPAGLGVHQAKPEVFFIRYNNKHEAEAQISGGIHGQKVGINVPDLQNESHFVSALDGSSVGYGSQGHVGSTEIGGHGISESLGQHGPAGASGPY